ncbi:three-Cys-motif partner protein TcmP [Patulibacter sp. SYSU D01012]|uniref:three-Cys-motif partner protein TcmP n=1 Tax=Patulibacter sp. SYSU D01012 TaxID=2817381 RepID=UPI0024A62458|nr:three-Cys-motif partner protein TcmP [Patulibacter sp. SYSU D01012]
MPAPRSVLWDYQPHTAAKHLLLEKYLDAWFSILGQTPGDLVFVDGFAGPGEYRAGEPGSPLIALSRYEAARAAHGSRFRARVQFWFIDEDARRVKHLEGLIERRFPKAAVTTKVGEFAAVYPHLYAERASGLRNPGVFAFIDPFGADGEATMTAAQIVAVRRCEVLLYVPTNYINRFVDTPEFRGRLAAMEPHIDWDEVASVPGDRRGAIRDAIARLLQCDWVRWFEITPASGHNTYTMIFGTNSPVGLRRMKKAMWDVDPQGGTRFRDTTDAAQQTLFAPEPDYGDLHRRLRRHFGTDVFTVADALDYTLFDTPYRDDKHLKKTVLAPAEKAGTMRVVWAPAGRHPRTYKDPRIRLAFVA